MLLIFSDLFIVEKAIVAATGKQTAHQYKYGF